jgi:molybdenum cofactor biosynthesis enzyme MoaA
MRIEIEDKSLMMIFLLEECNFSCIHCIREDEPIAPGYKLSFKQLKACLSDCRKMKSISWVHFTGGEPTLWKEEKRNLVDLLLVISKAGFTPGFTSNGSYFVDYGRCQDFLAKYVDSSSMPLRIYFSIDTFHRNFNRKKGRARCLDNFLKCRQEFPPAKANQLNISVIVTISKDKKSLLPEEMIKYYESLGVSIGFVPLFPMGKAKSFSHLCPDLESDNPEDLGAYRRYFRIIDRKRRSKAANRNWADFINLIGNDYYFTNPWRKVAQLGNLPDTIISAYSDPGAGL